VYRNNRPLGFWSSEMLHCVAGSFAHRDVSKESGTFIFKGW